MFSSYLLTFLAGSAELHGRSAGLFGDLFGLESSITPDKSKLLARCESFSEFATVTSTEAFGTNSRFKVLACPKSLEIKKKKHVF